MSLLTSLISAGGGSLDPNKSYDGEVTTYSALPDATINTNKIYLVLAEQGVNQAGFYKSNGSTWLYVGHDYDTLDDIPDGTTNKAYTQTEKTKLSTIESNAINSKNSFTQNAGQYIATEGIKARDIYGISLLNQQGTKGIFLNDSGNLGIGNMSPATKVVIEGTNTKAGNGLTFRADQGGGASERFSMYAEHGSTFTFNQPADGSIRFIDHSGVDIFHVSTWLQRVGVMNSNPKHKLSVGEDLGSLIGTWPGLGVQGGIVTGSANANSVIGLQNWGSGSKLFSYNYGGGYAIPISIQPDNANVYICQGGGNVGIGTTSPSQRLQVNGNAVVSGSLSKGSGSFDIPHPIPSKKKTHRLRHYFVETPSAGGNIYKYKIECVAGENLLKLPTYFEYLNKNTLVWVSPFRHFGRAYGEIMGNFVKIECESSGTFNVLIFGDRKDETAVKDFNKYGIEYETKKKG
jgi:hypothetical protein